MRYLPSLQSRYILPASILLILAGLIIANACAPLYTPNVVHTTLARKSGTVQGGVFYGAGAFNGMLEAVPLDNVSVLGSYSYEPWSFTGKALTADDSVWAKHKAHSFWESGLGYSTMFGATTQLDLIAGYGAGHASALWPNDSEILPSIYPIVEAAGSPLAGIYRVDGDYRRVFVQATMSGNDGKSAKDSIEFVGLALRASYVWFTDLIREKRSTLHPRAFFVDPVAFFHAGTEHLQFEMQGGFSVKFPLNNDQLRVQVIFIELGVRGRLDGLW
jgi:hypothetical protein